MSRPEGKWPPATLPGVGVENYASGARKTFGDEVLVNEFSGLDPTDLPRAGDYVLLKTRAHKLIEVTPYKSRTDAIRYRAVIVRRQAVPSGARTFESHASIQERANP